MTVVLSTSEPVDPSSEDVRLAREVGEFLSNGEAADLYLTLTLSRQGQEKTIRVPAGEVPALLAVLAEVAKGQSVMVLPLDKELSTQQAADLLNVSRPFFIRLLEKQEIPYRMVGTWRRIRLADVLAYKRRAQAQSEAALQELADQAQELNLGY